MDTEVSQMLRSCGLQNYADRFAEEGYDDIEDLDVRTIEILVENPKHQRSIKRALQHWSKDREDLTESENSRFNGIAMFLTDEQTNIFGLTSSEPSSEGAPAFALLATSHHLHLLCAHSEKLGALNFQRISFPNFPSNSRISAIDHFCLLNHVILGVAFVAEDTDATAPCRFLIYVFPAMSLQAVRWDESCVSCQLDAELGCAPLKLFHLLHGESTVFVLAGTDRRLHCFTHDSQLRFAAACPEPLSSDDGLADTLDNTVPSPALAADALTGPNFRVMALGGQDGQLYVICERANECRRHVLCLNGPLVGVSLFLRRTPAPTEVNGLVAEMKSCATPDEGQHDTVELVVIEAVGRVLIFHDVLIAGLNDWSSVSDRFCPVNRRSSMSPTPPSTPYTHSRSALDLQETVEMPPSEQQQNAVTPRGDYNRTPSLSSARKQTQVVSPTRLADVDSGVPAGPRRPVLDSRNMPSLPNSSSFQSIGRAELPRIGLRSSAPSEEYFLSGVSCCCVCDIEGTGYPHLAVATLNNRLLYFVPSDVATGALTPSSSFSGTLSPTARRLSVLAQPPPLSRLEYRRVFVKRFPFPVLSIRCVDINNDGILELVVATMFECYVLQPSVQALRSKLQRRLLLFEEFIKASAAPTPTTTDVAGSSPERA
eukprot:TRINITY_DN21778_c0_g1_i1.p1 TRINITY_DN21778_c0_g1~~TRINITY_DN21778_c0_g1_i1.p1  ORF type:complete len:655 (-),score=77.16 TRINITY_DN21778_c0_g1_i1:165-2129(-)